MFTTSMLLLALLTGVDDAGPLPAEPTASFECRTRLQPRARRCAKACTERHPDREPRWDCVAACTAHALDAMADCRRASTSGAASAASVDATPDRGQADALARR